jgi:hypothetical protein
MNKAVTRPPANDLYETDFYAWTQEQARLLRERRWADLDLANLVDEVEGVGKSEKREIRSRLEILIAHLLKWKLQPGGRGSSWRATIFEQRQQISDIVHDSPSLQEFQRKQVCAVYRAARLLAGKETGIAFGLFPDQCPFSTNEVLDPEFFPEDPERE